MRRDNDRITGCLLDSIEDAPKRLKIFCGIRRGATRSIEVGVAGKSVVNEYTRRRDRGHCNVRTK